MFKKRDIMRKDKFAWVYKHAPKKLEDVVLLDRIRPIFERCIEQKQIPDMMLYGPAGVGKTTLFDVLNKEIDFEVLHLNGSIDNSIDNIRNDVKTFTRRAAQKPKVVFFDEACRMSTPAQDGTKAEIESCQKTAFFFTANHIERMVDPLVSRCGGGISFFYNEKEKKELQKKYFKRATQILDLEEVKYNKKAVAKVVQKCFPDMRKTIHSLQSIHNQYEEINMDGVDSLLTIDFKELFTLIKSGIFSDIRQYCYNLTTDYRMFYGAFIKEIEEHIEESSIPEVIIQAFECQKYTLGNPDPQVPLIAFCIYLMGVDLI